MTLPMVDCRGLIEFCRAFEQHKNMAPSINNNRSNKKFSTNSTSVNSSSHSFCERSPSAAIDILMLILVIGALGVLIIPYITAVYRESMEILPLVCDEFGEIISDAPIVYVVGLVAVCSGVIATIVAWEIIEAKSRKCGKRNCKGLRKAIEFDIQLEPEECVKYLPSGGTVDYDVKPLELGQDHRELEAELKKMAPINGRTVLIFRAPCGCPAGRLEVWGARRIRRIKK